MCECMRILRALASGRPFHHQFTPRRGAAVPPRLRTCGGEPWPSRLTVQTRALCCATSPRLMATPPLQRVEPPPPLMPLSPLLLTLTPLGRRRRCEVAPTPTPLMATPPLPRVEPLPPPTLLGHRHRCQRRPRSRRSATSHPLLLMASPRCCSTSPRPLLVATPTPTPTPLVVPPPPCAEPRRPPPPLMPLSSPLLLTLTPLGRRRRCHHSRRPRSHRGPLPAMARPTVAVTRGWLH